MQRIEKRQRKNNTRKNKNKYVPMLIPFCSFQATFSKWLYWFKYLTFLLIRFTKEQGKIWVFVRIHQMYFHCFLHSMNLRFLDAFWCFDINLNCFAVFFNAYQKVPTTFTRGICRINYYNHPLIFTSKFKLHN